MNIAEPVNPGFPEVYQWDYNDDVIGGDEGPATRPIKQLVERDAFLKKSDEAEAEARENADNELQDQVSENRQRIDAMKGRGGYLTAHDFGKADPSQEELNAYAISQIASDDPLDIWNGTHVKNLFDDHAWVLTNTQDTDPSIHEWTDDGLDSVSEISNDSAGVVKGAVDPGDGSKEGYLEAAPGGEAKVIGFADRVIYLEGNTSSLELPAGAYKSDEKRVVNDTNGVVELLNGDKAISIQLGEIIDIRWNGTEWRVKTDKLVGDFIQQLPSERSPVDKCLEGEYEKWSGRAVIYGVSAAAPPASIDYFAFRQATPNIAAGSRPVVCHHLPGSDWQLYRFKAGQGAYAVPENFDPIKWDLISPDLRVVRETCQKLATRNTATGLISSTADLAIGDQIAEGDHAGKYIAEVIVLGGKFISVEGGYRPTFVDGGTDDDQIRDIKGQINTSSAIGIIYSGSGTFIVSNRAANYPAPGVAASDVNSVITFDIARVVKTGPDNAPRTLSAEFWRRVA